MRIIKLQNKKIKDLLEKKRDVVLKGRELSAKIEKEAEKIVDKELVVNGIKVDKKRNCSGKYDDFKKFFNQENQIAINENIQKKLANELDELEKMNGFVNKYNGEVSRLLDKEKLDLGEFEVPHKIDLKGSDIEVEILDNLEEYKKRYKEIKAKK
jgi:hypothetical protein